MMLIGFGMGVDVGTGVAEGVTVAVGSGVNVAVGVSVGGIKAAVGEIFSAPHEAIIKQAQVKNRKIFFICLVL